jgi:2-polyprenyl-3-methyl-5-hydroxy-6-metoxy-1,4-benzoquinol methylase
MSSDNHGIRPNRRGVTCRLSVRGDDLGITNLPEVPCPICDSSSFSAVTFRYDYGRLVACDDCGHIFLNPTLTDEMIAEIYKKYHSSGEERAEMEIIDAWFNTPRGQYQYSLDLIEREGGMQGKNVVELGCGPGRFLYECRERGARVTGIDNSPGAVSLAKQHFNLDLIHETVEDAVRKKSVSSCVFDYVFAFEIIEHVRDPRQFVNIAWNLLAPGGVAFVSTPNFHLYRLMGKAAPVVNQWPEHLHYFDPPSLKRCLQCNFESVTVTSLMPLSFGDRKKQVIIRMPLVSILWQSFRKLKVVCSIKETIFQQLNKLQAPADQISWNGTTLIAIARKPLS